MTHPVRNGHRPLFALATLVLLVCVGSGTTASAADHGNRGGDYRDRYYDGDRYHDRDRDRYDHRHGKYKKKYDKGYHGRYDHGYDDRRYDRGYRYYDGGPARFAAPHHLYRRDYGAYERYYRGTAYYAPHRHYHRIYLFPVIVDGYYTDYRPYAYCGEAYFPQQYGYGEPRGQFGLHFNF